MIQDLLSNLTDVVAERGRQTLEIHPTLDERVDLASARNHSNYLEPIEITNQITLIMLICNGG